MSSGTEVLQYKIPIYVKDTYSKNGTLFFKSYFELKV